jgi:exosortase
MQAEAALVHRTEGIGASRLWLSLGLAALVVPTLISIARQHWSTEDGAHGPIILATGLWLIWRARAWLAQHALPIRGWLWAVPLLPLLLAYAFARAYNILSVETGVLYLMLVLVALGYWGWAAARHLWFPLFYFAFLIVPPGSIVAELTLPLKLWISQAAVELLYLFGYPVAQTGAALHIDQYELLVETACAGLGSLLTLSALGLLYVHLRWNSGLRRSVALMALVLPIAILANFIRVVVLVLLTYYFGNEVAQGVAHDAAGMLMFVIAMLGMLAADALLQRFAGRKA